MTRLRLPAPTPREWFATHLHAYLHQWDGDDLDESRRHWYSGAQAWADDLAILRATHQRYVAEGASPQAATKWVVGEHVDLAAAALTAGYVAAGAVAVDLDPAAVRFGTHPDGWVQLVDVGEPRLVVVAGHPWTGRPGVTTVPDAQALAAALVGTVEELARFWYPAAKRLGKVGPSALWAETSDAIGMCTMHRPTMPSGPDVLADLRLVLDAPSAPWRKRPRLWFAEVGGDRKLLGQKAGCCLAYQGEHADAEPVPGDDPRSVSHRERFAEQPGAPAYCATCCFRDPDDVEARLVFDLEWDARERAVPGRPD